MLKKCYCCVTNTPDATAPQSVVRKADAKYEALILVCVPVWVGPSWSMHCQQISCLTMYGVQDTVCICNGSWHEGEGEDIHRALSTGSLTA
jgi:hypothetical protein